MLSRDNIVFEFDALAHVHTVSQDTVKDELVVLVNKFIAELGIYGLDKIVVKETKLWDVERGLADYKSNTITLANNIAYCLADKSSLLYPSPLAVLKHEMYHFLDYQNLVLNRARNNITQLDADFWNNYRYWTEFFASYSTFEVCEDEELYSSFESVFEKSNSTCKEKKYFTCRLFGYYLHDSHSEKCDKLVAQYLSGKALEKTVSSFKSVLQSYPCYSAEQIINAGLAINEVIETKDDIASYTPISKEDFWKQMLNKPKRS